MRELWNSQNTRCLNAHRQRSRILSTLTVIALHHRSPSSISIIALPLTLHSSLSLSLQLHRALSLSATPSSSLSATPWNSDLNVRCSISGKFAEYEYLWIYFGISRFSIYQWKSILWFGIFGIWDFWV
jgi:hypothetical protein